MACAAFFLIAVFAASEATLQCSLADDSGSGSMDSPQQVSTLEYCVVDNCTIMRIDNGQKLDIVYTTESIIVVNPIDGQTSSVIAKNDNEFPCLLPDTMAYDNYMAKFIGSITIVLLITAVSSYILIVHLLFKELHNLMGKLMIFYNLTLIFLCIIIGVWLFLYYIIPANSQITCHSIVVLFMITLIGNNNVSTCILTYLTNIMYRSYKLRSRMSKPRSKFLLKCYTAYIVGTVIFYLFIIVAYDLRTGNGKDTLEPLNGYCHFFGEKFHDFYISSIATGINKVVQIILFTVYLYFFYKINTQTEQLNRQYTKHLFIIAIAMGAKIGLTEFIWISTTILGLNNSPIPSIVGAIFLLIQQCVIMITFMCTPKMSQLCKELFLNNEQ